MLAKDSTCAKGIWTDVWLDSTTKNVDRPSQEQAPRKKKIESTPHDAMTPRCHASHRNSKVALGSLGSVMHGMACSNWNGAGGLSIQGCE